MAREKLKTLTEQMFYVLLVLTHERYGSEIVSEVLKITNNRISLGPGTLYTLLAQFEEEKLITQTKQEGRKRSYCINIFSYISRVRSSSCDFNNTSS